MEAYNPTEIEEETKEFPLLGYTVIANVQGIEIDHNTLLQLLTPLGLTHFAPGIPEESTTLRRSLKAWLKDQAKYGGRSSSLFSESEDDDRQIKKFIREIKVRRSHILTLALIEENIDLHALGLSYLTNLRVFLNKQTGDLTLTTTASGQASSSMSQKDQSLLATLLPFWQIYKERHTGGDLSRMVQEIISNMAATAMRKNGGVYFVPYAKRDELRRLKDLIEVTLPQTAGVQTSNSYVIHLPIIDRPQTKQQMGQITHRSFLAELVALQKDLEQFTVRLEKAATTEKKRGNQGRVSQMSILTRLEQYQGLKAKVKLYSETLDLKKEEILMHLEQLQATARALLETAATALEEEEPQTGSFEDTQELSEGEEATI